MSGRRCVIDQMHASERVITLEAERHHHTGSFNQGLYPSKAAKTLRSW